MQDLTGWELQIVHAYKASGGTSGSHGFETPDRTCLLGVRTALHDLTGSEHKIIHAHNVSGRSCRISQVGNYRSNMPTRHQERTSGSHGFETPDRTCLLGVRMALHDLRARNKRSYMPTRYPDGVARSHGFGTPDRTCLEGIRKGLQDLTGKPHQIVNAYKISPPGCRVSRVRDTRSNTLKRYQDGAAGSHWSGPTDSTCLQGIRSGLQHLTDKTHQTEPAYKVSSRSCRISRVGNYRSYMPTRYQEVTSGSHGFETPDRTRLRDIRTRLQDLTGSDQQIQHAYKVSGRGCRTSRVRHIRSNLPTRYQVGVAGSHGLGTTDRTCLQGIRRGL